MYLCGEFIEGLDIPIWAKASPQDGGSEERISRNPEHHNRKHPLSLLISQEMRG